VRNARIAQPDGSVHEGDLACERGLIAKIGPSLDAQADEMIDAGGKLLLPGTIDPQVHFREPGAPHKEDLASGSRAAVKGGVTSFLDMPNTNPPTINQKALDDKLASARRKCVANYGFFIGATPNNLHEINTASPVCGIKIFMGASTGDLLVHDPKDLERIFANGNRLIAVHAEDEKRIQERRVLFAENTDPAVHSEIRDNQCAALATELALTLSTRYERRLHILHLSTHDEVGQLQNHKPSWVTAEAIPNHLYLNVEHYAKQGTLVQMNPPIRQPEDNLPLMLTHMKAGKCTLAELQKWMCWGPAQAYQIANKGKITEGWDADLILVDIDTVRPARNQDMFTKAGWTPYDGWPLTGWPIYTIVGGCIAFDQGSIRDNVRGQALNFTT
jgi:dihydroorotase